MLEWAKEDLDRAVICRSNKQVSHFKRALVDGGIKVVGRGAKPADFNEFTAFIGVLGDPQNDTVANTFAIRHLGSKPAKAIRQQSEATCISMTDLLCEKIDWLQELIQRAQIVSSMPELVELCARGYSEQTVQDLGIAPMIAIRWMISWSLSRRTSSTRSRRVSGLAPSTVPRDWNGDRCGYRSGVSSCSRSGRMTSRKRIAGWPSSASPAEKIPW